MRWRASRPLLQRSHSRTAPAGHQFVVITVRWRTALGSGAASVGDNYLFVPK